MRFKELDDGTRRLAEDIFARLLTDSSEVRVFRGDGDPFDGDPTFTAELYPGQWLDDPASVRDRADQAIKAAEVFRDAWAERGQS